MKSDALLNRLGAINHMVSTRDSQRFYQHFLTIGLIFIITILTTGVFIHRFGLYGDQWVSVLHPSDVGSNLYLDERIQSAIIFFIGKQPFLYHLLNMLLLSFSGILAYILLLRLNFGNFYSTAGSLLFLVFPTFGQPGAAFALSSILLGLSLSLLSAICYLFALSQNRIVFWNLFIAFVFSLLSLFITPIITLFEGLLIIGIALYVSLGEYGKRKGWILGTGLGHLVVSILIVLGTNPVETNIRSLFLSTIREWFSEVISIWRKVISFPSGGGQVAVYLAILLIAACFLTYLLSKLHNGIQQADWKTGKNDICIFAGLVIFTICFIFEQKIAHISVTANYPDDLGILVSGFLLSILTILGIKILFLEKYQAILFSLLIVLSAGARFQISQRFANESAKVDSFLSQLQVRGNALEEGTSIVVEQLPLDFTSIRSINALVKEKMNVPEGDASVNIISANEPGFQEFLADSGKNSRVLRIDNLDLAIDKTKILTIWQPENGCLHLIEPDTDIVNLPKSLALTKKFSNPSLLVPDQMSDVKQHNTFRATINPAGCYFYQMGTRLLQEKKWDDVIDLYQQEKDQNLSIRNFEEVQPLLRAYLEKGKYFDAVHVSQKFNLNPESQQEICKTWTDTLQEKLDKEEVVQEVRKSMAQIGCNNE